MENAGAQGTATVLGKSANILQVENNELNRNGLRRPLPHKNFEVVFATEYRQGLATALMDSCAQLLLGKLMPGATRNPERQCKYFAYLHG
jgi:hypothetical protein